MFLLCLYLKLHLTLLSYVSSHSSTSLYVFRFKALILLQMINGKTYLNGRDLWGKSTQSVPSLNTSPQAEQYTFFLWISFILFGCQVTLICWVLWYHRKSWEDNIDLWTGKVRRNRRRERRGTSSLEHIEFSKKYNFSDCLFHKSTKYVNKV